MFNHNVKPNFEDGKFIADYLLDLQDAKAVFDRDAVYFYRKREKWHIHFRYFLAKSRKVF